MSNNYTEDVVDAVAEAKGSEPDEWNFVIHEYIDLDAVNRLANHKQSSWTLSFEIPNHRVVVTSDGTVFVDDAQEYSAL